ADFQFNSETTSRWLRQEIKNSGLCEPFSKTIGGCRSYVSADGPLEVAAEWLWVVGSGEFGATDPVVPSSEARNRSRQCFSASSIGGAGCSGFCALAGEPTVG